MPKGIGQMQLKKTEKTEKQILETLKEHGEITWGDLVEKSGLSTSTLHKHLKRLEKEEKIIKRIDPNSGYPPHVYYRVTEQGIETLHRYEYIIEIGRVILETKSPVNVYIDEIGAPTKTLKNWMNFPGQFYRGFLREPDKYRGMIIPLKFLKDFDKKELDELIVYAVLPRKEFQDTFDKIQNKFKTEEEKQKVGKKMFRSGLKAIKEAFETLLQEWKDEYQLD